MTKIDAMNSRIGQTLYHVSQCGSNGAATRVTVNGKCKTWKNGNFRLPVKVNGRCGFDITPSNAQQWSMISPQLAVNVA